MSDELIVKFKKWTCAVELFRYAYDNSPCIVLLDAEDYSRVAVGTVCADRKGLRQFDVIIKDYSENEGMLEALVDGGVVTSMGAKVPVGHATCPVATLTTEARLLLEKFDASVS